MQKSWEIRQVAALLPLFLLSCGTGYSQTPGPGGSGQGQPVSEQKPDPRDNRQRPLTPEEERLKLLNQFDPLAPDEQGAGQQADPKRPRVATPLPGSIAASNRDGAQQSQGPRVVSADGNNPSQEYTGPAVLSRSYTIDRPMVPSQLKFSETFAANGIYDTGLVQASLDDAGKLKNNSPMPGTSTSWNVTGRHLWRHDQVGAVYSGDLSWYGANSVYNGGNHALNLDYTHYLSRRWSITLSESGSIRSQNYTLETPGAGPGSIANVNLASSPNIQIFDNGTKQLSSQADMTWRKTARLSFNFGIGWFGISRNSPSLVGTTGRQARGDVSYRLSRKTTIGTYYSYSKYLFPHGVGTSDINTIGGIYSYAFNKSLQLRMRAGITHTETLALTTVQIDPVIAALLGQSSGLIDAYRTSNGSDISAQLVKDFGSNRTAFFAYARGISPGNGVYLTSSQESMNGSFTVQMRKVYTFSLNAGRDQLSSVSQTVGNYKSENATLQMSRKFRHGVGLNFTASLRHFDVANAFTVRNQLRFMVGFTFTPENGQFWPFSR